MRRFKDRCLELQPFVRVNVLTYVSRTEKVSRSTKDLLTLPPGKLKEVYLMDLFLRNNAQINPSDILHWDQSPNMPTLTFLSAGANFAHLHRGVPYTERNSPANSNTMLEKKTSRSPDGGTSPPCHPALYSP